MNISIHKPQFQKRVLSKLLALLSLSA